MTLLSSVLSWQSARLPTTGWSMYLVYHWQWDLVFQYVVAIDEVTGEIFPNLFLKGVAMTLRLALWGTLIAGIIGIYHGNMPLQSESVFEKHEPSVC